MTSGRMDDDMPDTIRRNEHTKKCRHTMPEKWTEIDGEEGERAKGEGRGARGERRGAKGEGRKERGIQKLPHSTGERGSWGSANLADTGGSWGSAKLGGYGREVI